MTSSELDKKERRALTLLCIVEMNSQGAEELWELATLQWLCINAVTVSHLVNSLLTCPTTRRILVKTPSFINRTFFDHEDRS